MKKLFLLVIYFLFFAFLSFNLYARGGQAKVETSPSIAGATGVVTTPSASLVSSKSALALDLSAYMILGEEETFILPNTNLGLFGLLEAGLAYDIQSDDKSDFIIHSKLKFLPWRTEGSSGLAVGGNYQLLDSISKSSGQIYLVASYTANLFGASAETSITVGKTFSSVVRSGDIDFSMGFIANFFPNIFQGYLYWLVDIANYSYSIHAVGSDYARGIANTGLRVLVLKNLSSFKLNFDILFTDVFDDSRTLSAGVTFGMLL